MTYSRNERVNDRRDFLAKLLGHFLLIVLKHNQKVPEDKVYVFPTCMSRSSEMAPREIEGPKINFLTNQSLPIFSM
jgi:hypothetical protein